MKEASEKPIAPKYRLNADAEEIRELHLLTCVYVIENTVTGCKYVGQTGNARSRFRSHAYTLRRGYHAHRLMQQDYNKYGAEAFYFYVVKVYNTPEERRTIEHDENEYIRRAENTYNTPKTPALKKQPYNYTLHTV
jgi:hypothetical protein